MLMFAPVVWWVTWIYMSPLHHLKGKFWVKLMIRVVLCTSLLGGVGAQLNFLAHRVTSLHTRQFHFLGLLIIECIPALAIMFYRYYQDPRSYGANWSRGVERPSKKR
jgi:hypothetical protein